MGRLKPVQKAFRRFAGWWFTVLLCVTTLAIFLQATHRQSLQLEELQGRRHELQLLADQLRESHIELREQIQAHHSAAWMEQTLIHRLGVIPMGAIKVVFLPPSEGKTPSENIVSAR